ncbi:MAG: CHAD domain-containing protein [Pseudomonadota bacterium]
MSYEFRFDQPADAEARRILAALADRAAAVLSDAPDPTRSVFKARRAAKRARALLTLARPALSKEQYAEQNTAWREAGRTLSGLRDVSAVSATLERLAAEEVADDDLKSAYEQLRDIAATRERCSLRRHEAAARLARAWQFVDEAKRVAPSFETLQPADLIAGARKVYRRGRKEMRDASREASADRDHDWRKRVKHHGLHMRLLRPLDPKSVGVQERRAKDAAAALGWINDLAVAAIELSGLAEDVFSQRALRSVADGIAMKRDKAREAAFDRAELVYQDTPQRFAARLIALDPDLFAPPGDENAVRAAS